jgi:PAS domain S-box-containing protein
MQDGEILEKETRFRRKDGKYIYLENIAVVFKDEKEDLNRVVGVLRDITEKVTAQHELQKNEEKFLSIAEQTGQLIIDGDTRTEKIRWAGAIEEITGYTPEEFSKVDLQACKEAVHPEDRERVFSNLLNCLHTGERFNQEFRFRRKDRSYRYVENSSVFLKDEAGNIYRAFGVIKDITKRKLAEEALARTEEMRKKEIHHRIKNNLQVISSLLDLEAEKFADEKVVEAFRDSQNRVISMSLIHEELYKSGDKETLDFTEYLKKLTDKLVQSYRVGNSKIHLLSEIEPEVRLHMDLAIPLGTVINELVSNSLKHAFPGEREGEIRITLSDIESARIGSNCFLLTISDNGAGFPDTVDFKNPSSLGLQLVNTLVNQIEGRVVMQRNNGTEFRIWFGKKES